jgi:molybdopterin converting factor small subunit
MAVTVTFLGSLRDQTGGAKQLELDAATVDDLLELLGQRFGAELERSVRHARIVVNGTAVQFLKGGKTALAAGDEVAFLMPLGGG